MIRKLGGLLVLLGLFVGLMPLVASAHNVNVQGVASCVDAQGNWTVTWKVINSESGKAMTIEDVDLDTDDNFNGSINDDQNNPLPISENVVVPAGAGQFISAVSHFNTSSVVRAELEVEVDWPQFSGTDSDSAVVQKGERCIEQIANPGFVVSNETAVCNPQTGEFDFSGDGSFTLDAEVNFSWDRVSETDLSAGNHGTATADADNGFVFAGGDTFTTGDIIVGVTYGQQDCDELTTPVSPEVNQSEVCEIEGYFIVPTTEGVQYLVDGAEVPSGTQVNGPGIFGLTAEAEAGYELTDPHFSEQITLEPAADCPEVVTPVAPEVSQSEACEVEGSVIVPSGGGVIYTLDGVDVSGQTLNGPISGILLAVADEGHVLEPSAATRFAFNVEKAEECPPETTTTTTQPEETTTTTVPETTTTVPEVTTLPEVISPSGDVTLACVDGGLVANIVTDEADVAVRVNGQLVSFSEGVINGGTLEINAAEGDFVRVELYLGDTFLDAAEITVDCADAPSVARTAGTLPFTGDEGLFGLDTNGQIGLALTLAMAGILILVAARSRREDTI